MAFAIMRAKKLSGMGSGAASLQHCYRERDTPNADDALTPTNEHREAASTNESMGLLRSMLPEKRRKAAVLAVEYVMTASPSWWATASAEQQQQFFDRSVKWLADKYGADRIVTASIHRDEKTPHLSAFVVPLTADGRLSAKEFIGSKAKMTADQTSYAEVVRDLGLERGIEGSRAQHQRVKSYYAAIEQDNGHVTITPEALKPRVVSKGLFTERVESADQVAVRLTNAVRQGYAPAVQAAAGARMERQKARQAQDTARSLQKRLQPLLAALRPLDGQMQDKAIELLKAVVAKLMPARSQTMTPTHQPAPKGKGGIER